MFIGRPSIQLRDKMLFLVLLGKFTSPFQALALSVIRAVQITALSSDSDGKFSY